MRTLTLLASLALPVVVPAMAQQPHVQNGQVSTSNSSLTSSINALKAKDAIAWVAYTIPTSHRIQNGWNPDGVSYLENENRHDDSDDRNDSTKETYRALLLIRVANHAVERIRVEDPDRKLDAGGVHVEFLPNVEPEKSIAVLQQLAESTTTNKVRDGAVFAISLHQSSATMPALTALGSAGHDLQVREKAAFWLASQYKKQALPILDRWIKSDSDDRFREKLTFNLSMIHDPASADLLIRTAHDDASPRVRKQAQFWMATIAGKKVMGSLSDAAENDPNADVRKSAVFGLSRLPNNEGIPKLIGLAENSKDGGVRKQAVFWLGQSNDPRALDFLTKLVK